MIVDFLVEGDFQIEFSLREGESLGDQGTWESASTDWWGVLQFLDSESYGRPFVALKEKFAFISFFFLNYICFFKIYIFSATRRNLDKFMKT